jgi:hypothetical protein
LLGLAATAGAAASDLPDACTIVPISAVRSALGATKTPTSADAATSNTSTCSYDNGLLTIEIGYTALTNPFVPLHVTKVPVLPHGELSTFPHTTQTQLTFYRGSAATGLYAVIRSYGRIPAAKLEKLGVALNHGLVGVTGSGGIHIVSG